LFTWFFHPTTACRYFKVKDNQLLTLLDAPNLFKIEGAITMVENPALISYNGLPALVR